jgi:hypothetical protein
MVEINASSTGGERKLTPSGNFIARCFSMVHIGTSKEEYMGELKEMNKVRITWELPTETTVFKEENGEQPYSISKEFTLSLHEKATLRKFLESWRGQAFTEEQSKKFNICNLAGVPCMLNIIHKVSKTGNKYADIASVSAMPKGLQSPDQVNKSVIFSICQPDWEIFNKFPDFLKDKIKKTNEYLLLQVPEGIDTPSEHIEKDEEPTDLPF